MASPENSNFNFRSDDESDSSDARSEYSSPATTPTSPSEMKDSSQPSTMLPKASDEQHTKPEHPVESRSNSGIKDDLWLLHSDELVALAQKKAPVVAPEDSYGVTVRKVIKNYFHFVSVTWARCVWSLLFLPSTFMDRLTSLAFAFFSSTILFIIMLWCLALKSPYAVKRLEAWSQKSGGGLSMINASYPAMFRATTADEPYVIAARGALAKPMISKRAFHDLEGPRSFNVDIAKFLFQCAALMYERSSSPLLDVLQKTRDQLSSDGVSTKISPETAPPGRTLQAVVGTDTAKLVSECLHKDNVEENEMTRFAAKLGMKYSTISELNTQTSASAGLFWDPKSTFIILAFKGTQPDEFVEWAGDFTYEPRDAGDWIRGFGKVHGGFLERVFPRKVAPGSRVPYYTIRDAVRHTAAHLLEKQPAGTKINVWFTGHSLGTAIASLVYARAVNEPRDFGSDVVVRDAFMFAAPILCDVQSAHAFHNRMYHDERRTLWRITNSDDCVATALPDFGDNMRLHLSPYNLFSFSHLGLELKMHSVPKRRVVLSGNALPHGTLVIVETVGNKTDEAFTEVSQTIEKLAGIPLVGRVVSHGTAPYWDQLLRLQPGPCEWDA